MLILSDLGVTVNVFYSANSAKFFKMLKGTKIFRSQAKIVFRNGCVVRSKHFSEGFKLQKFGQKFSTTTIPKSFHKPQTLEYPATKQLPLPLNIKDLASSEKLKFSPQRSRDISSSYISYSTSSFTDVKTDLRVPADDRIECYDCSGAINLSSAMQTNVPFPFISRGKPVHLNMPGGQWRQKEKYVSEDLNNVHHINTRELNPRSGATCAFGNRIGTRKLYFYNAHSDTYFITSPWSFISNFHRCQLREFCTVKQKVEESEKHSNKENNKRLTPREKLKAAVTAYGPVIIVFHVGLSLISLGCCYLLISSGIDLSSIVKSFGADEGAATAGAAAGFVVAYAVHKTLAPARIALTLGAAPFVVRKLRKMGILKTPKPQ